MNPSRDLYASLALSYVPHLTQLVDRNPYSPTYGCFDREYWHYRTLDFPCGMSQEFVLPFALLFVRDYPGNRFYQWERLREIAIAGMRFAVKGSHRDGSCDDYFPFEQAMGALAFSTYAMTEAYQRLGLDDGALVEFFRKRGRHLIRHNETGRLSNHQAIAALAAYNIFRITGDEAFRHCAEERMELALSWQNKEEGWFQEYEGADPGYHTCSIDFLAKLHQKSAQAGKPYDGLIAPLVKAVEFAWYFMHPDGSYGGEYGSRNTYHFYPHGFELMAAHSEKAGQIADQFLRGAAGGTRYHNDDDRMVCHCVYNWLQAWEDYHPRRPATPLNARAPFLQWFPAAGMAICKTDNYYAVANLNKGGVLKVYGAPDRPAPDAPDPGEGSAGHRAGPNGATRRDVCCTGSDTGLIGELDNGGVIVTHLMDAQHRVTAYPERGVFVVEGVFSRRRSKLNSPVRMILFRLVNITVGRFFPNLLRAAVQKLLITGKKRLPWRFRRTLRFDPDAVRIADEIPGPIPLRRLSAGSDATSIYVANSNVYQESVLRVPWTHAPAEIVEQARSHAALWEREIKGR